MKDKEEADQKKEGSIFVWPLEREDQVFMFRQPLSQHLNRYLSKSASSKNILGAAKDLVRDTASPDAWDAIVQIAKEKPAIYQAFANLMLNESGVTDEVSVQKK